MEAPPVKQEEIKPVEVVDEEEEEEEEVTGKSKTNLNERLITHTKKNEIQEVEKCLKKKADVNYEENNKKKWTAFIWACCQGNIKIVKLLIAKGAAQNYLEVKLENRIVPPGSTKEMKPNPLHWASFKNHVDIVSILLKTGLHWEDVDTCGNNSVMLAAAGNSLESFKVFMQYGVSLECKNARGHTVKDLTTNVQILKLTEKCEQAKECCCSGALFKEKEIKYWCWVCGDFSNSNNQSSEWIQKNLETVEKERIDGRCKKCWGNAQKMRKQLQQAIDQYEQERLKQVLNKFKPKENEIEMVFRDKSHKVCHKLEVQNQILNYIKSLSKVENYKIILKSVNNIQKMLKDAEPLGIDKNVITLAHQQIDRLNAQRNLRFEIDNIDTSVATREGVSKLEEVYTDAETKSVSTQYLSVAGEIKEKMTKSILAQDIYQLFCQYPERPDPYPAPLVIDFKTKKPLDPETKKPTDPANLIPKKKKGKKAVQFVIPEWALDLKDANDKIKEEEELIERREELGLGEEFCKNVQEKIVLMKKEARYRKDMDTLQNMVNEATKKKK